MNKVRVSSQDLLVMTEQLAILIHAKLPIIFCLTTLSQQFKPSLRKVFKQMITMIEQGKHLYAALQLFPTVFPHYFIYLIKVGEETGRLAEVLGELATYQAKMLQRKQQLQKALLYPVFVFAISLLITLALLLFIVPQFQLLFADVAHELPLMTRFVFGLSTALHNLTLLPYLILLFSFFILVYCLSKKTLLLHMPIMGKIIHNHHQIRYLRSLSVALQAGLPLVQSLKLASGVMHKTSFADKTIKVPSQIQSGMNLKQAFIKTAQFCDIVIQLVHIGEQTSSVPMMLAHSAHILEQQLDKQIQHMTALLQPILILSLGVILGGLMIALYLPVFKLGTLY
jgi:type IV pilus assembly protein PilC